MPRPQMPRSVKDKVWRERGGICGHCEQSITRGDEDYNHILSLEVRTRDFSYKPTDARHYVPNANDTAFIDLRHGARTGAECHDVQTFGKGRRLGDVQWSAKRKRIIAKRVEAAQRRAAREAGEAIEKRSKYKWPKRKIPNRKISGWKNTRGEAVYAKRKP